MMTATSGRSCTAALTKCDPIGSCVRMLLESSRWSSRATLLKWRLRKVYSTRVTHFTDTDSKRPLPLNASAKTLSVTDMPSKRLLFQLVPLMHRTVETECSSSATVLLQTPTTVQTDEPPEKMRERAAHNGYKNGTKFGSLTSQLKYDPRVQTMLKTPCAADSYTDNMTSQGVSGTSGTLAQEIVSGYAEKHRGFVFPTPSARDWKGKTNPGVVKQGSGCIYGETLPDAIDRMMQGGQLLPTPIAVEREHPERVAALKATGATKINSRNNGEQRPNGMIDFMQFYGLLPTPRAMEVIESPQAKVDRLHDRTANSMPNLQSMAVYCPSLLPTPKMILGCLKSPHNAVESDNKYLVTKGGQKFTMDLVDLAARGLLPAPRSNVVNEMDLNNPALAERNKSNLEEEVAKIVVSQGSADGTTSRLSPLFTEEMMGFPSLWVTLPFLRQSGEPNHSKPTETP